MENHSCIIAENCVCECVSEVARSQAGDSWTLIRLLLPATFGSCHLSQLVFSFHPHLKVGWPGWCICTACCQVSRADCIMHGGFDRLNRGPYFKRSRSVSWEKLASSVGSFNTTKAYSGIAIEDDYNRSIRSHNYVFQTPPPFHIRREACQKGRVLFTGSLAWNPASFHMHHIWGTRKKEKGLWSLSPFLF